MSTTQHSITVFVEAPDFWSENKKMDLENVGSYHVAEDALKLVSKFGELKAQFPNPVPYNNGLTLKVSKKRLHVDEDGCEEEEEETAYLTPSDSKLFALAMHGFGHVHVAEVLANCEA